MENYGQTLWQIINIWISTHQSKNLFLKNVYGKYELTMTNKYGYDCALAIVGDTFIVPYGEPTIIEAADPDFFNKLEDLVKYANMPR